MRPTDPAHDTQPQIPTDPHLSLHRTPAPPLTPIARCCHSSSMTTPRSSTPRPHQTADAEPLHARDGRTLRPDAVTSEQPRRCCRPTHSRTPKLAYREVLPHSSPNPPPDPHSARRQTERRTVSRSVDLLVVVGVDPRRARCLGRRRPGPKGAIAVDRRCERTSPLPGDSSSPPPSHPPPTPENALGAAASRGKSRTQCQDRPGRTPPSTTPPPPTTDAPTHHHPDLPDGATAHRPTRTPRPRSPTSRHAQRHHPTTHAPPPHAPGRERSLRLHWQQWA